MAAKRKKLSRPKTARKLVWLPVPDEFLDVMGELWNVRRNDGTIDEDVGFLRVVMTTIRRCPVATAGDSERAYDILQVFRSAEGDEAEYVELSQDDFDWMQRHFKEHSHKIWAAPDSAYLRKWLEDRVLEENPEEVDEQASAGTES